MSEKEVKRDVVIIGGGLSGVAAALTLAEQGKSVVLTEEFSRVGGQLTTQAVPPDENPYIDGKNYGCTARYREVRNNIREYYRRNYPLTERSKQNPALNPGNGWVSGLCPEDEVSQKVLNKKLAPHVESGQITIFTHTTPTAAEVSGDKIMSVTVDNKKHNEQRVLHGHYYMDASERGDLLPLTGTEYVTGAESQAQTGEPHALAGPANPYDMQGITHCFTMEYLPGEDHTIDKPEQYGFLRNDQADFEPDKHLSWTSLHPETLEAETKTLFLQPGETDPTRSLWLYRQILNTNNFIPGAFRSSRTLVNWPQNDSWFGPVIDVPRDEEERNLEMARQLSRSMFFWMQQEAPRPDGGIGYPGLRFLGFAEAPYIREARRIKAIKTVYEQDISVDARGDRGPKKFLDTVGIGSYRIDLHPSTAGQGPIDIATYDFQLPLGSLIPERMENLVAAEKSIGTTHITNGSYRLHPVVWNIGESGGLLLSHAIDTKETPRGIRANRLDDFQRLLIKQEIELDWPHVGIR